VQSVVIAYGSRYGFTSSPGLRALKLVDRAGCLSEDVIRSILDPHAATLESLSVEVPFNSSIGSRWVYPICRMQALVSLRLVDMGRANHTLQWMATGAFISCFSCIPTLAVFCITQFDDKFDDDQIIYELCVLHPGSIETTKIITARLSADGIESNGVFRSLTHFSMKAANIPVCNIGALAAEFPVLQHLTMAVYDQHAAEFLPAAFSAMPELRCVTYWCEAKPRTCLSINMANVSRALFALPDPLYVAVVGIDQVFRCGISVTVRPRAAYQGHSQRQGLYSVFTPLVTPGTFLPGGHSVWLAIESLVRTYMRHVDHRRHANMHSIAFKLARTSPVIISHMGRVPDCMQPLRVV
jgi:hypothetical protein